MLCGVHGKSLWGEIMTEAEQIMKRCQAGTRNYEEANNLHAACYGIIGKLLAQLEQWGSSAVTQPEYVAEQKRKTEELRSMLTQPKQEPDAWRIKVETKLRDGSVDVGYQLRNEKLSVYDEPLYTHPPQRTWVGLTDDEMLHIGVATGLERAAVEMISNKLKEKNNGT
jgi:hypothetical protein